MTHKYQVCDPLSPEERDALKSSIQEHGVRVPVEVDEEGNILDGHNRFEIARELGIACDLVVRSGFQDDESKRAYARQLNCARRQISDEGRMKMAEAQMRETPKWSNRRIARLTGVHVDTCQAMRERLVSSGDIPEFDKLEGDDGKQYQAKRKPKFPFLHFPGWQDWHRMEATSYLKQIDKEDHEAVNEMFAGSQRTPEGACRMLRALASLTAKDKQRFRDLWESGEARRRTLVLSYLNGVAPPQDERVRIAMAAAMEIRQAAGIEPDSEESRALAALAEKCLEVIRRIDGMQERW